jgi:hypothetical protein
MFRFVASPMMLVLAIAGGVTGATSAEQCDVKFPERSVFDIVAEDDLDTSLGTAFLVDSERALFLTVQHNVGSKNRLLRNGNFKFKFHTVSSGNNPYYLHEDWGLLRAEVDDPTVGLFPLPDVRLIYDAPSQVDLSDAKVLKSSLSLGNVQGVTWKSSISSSSTCQASQISMIEVGSSYDHGNSGAPIYSPGLCGVLGIASRFAIEDDVPNSDQTRRDLIRIFWNLSDKVRASMPQNSADETDITKRFDVLRSILKGQVFVKMVPSKCVVDSLLINAITEGQPMAQRLMREDTSALTKRVAKVIGKIDMNDEVMVASVADKISTGNWRWLDWLQLRDEVIRHDATLRSGLFYPYFDGTLRETDKRLRFAFVDTAYARAYKTAASVTPGQRSDFALATDRFIELNANWTADTTRWDLGLQVGSDFAGKLTAPQRLEAGMKLAGLVNGSTPWPDNFSPSAKVGVATAAAAYLAASLGLGEGDFGGDPGGLDRPEERGKGLATLVDVLRKLYPENSETPRPPQLDRLELALARSALEELKGHPGNKYRMLAAEVFMANKIANRKEILDAIGEAAAGAARPPVAAGEALPRPQVETTSPAPTPLPRTRSQP